MTKNSKGIKNCSKENFERTESCHIFSVENDCCKNEYCLYNTDKRYVELKCDSINKSFRMSVLIPKEHFNNNNKEKVNNV